MLEDHSNAQDPLETFVAPFLKTHCLDCHSGTEPEGKLNLELLDHRKSVSDKFQVWKEIERRVAIGNMPPKGASSHPTAQARSEFTERVRSILREESVKHAGDPGIVSVRRLNQAEYNNSLRDLIGVDLQPAREFPVDPANEAGFDNSGESLAMSAALLNKYLAASRRIAEHMVLTPNGVSFASHPVSTDTDRDKYCVQRIVDFYQKQPTEIADYLFAAWKAKSRVSDPETQLDKFATRYGLSSKYLALLGSALSEPIAGSEPIAESEPIAGSEPIGPMAEVRRRWQSIADQDENIAREECRLLRDFILTVRRQLEPKFNMRLKGIHDGAQAFVLWKNRQSAKHRRSFVPDTLSELSLDKLASEVSAVLKAPDDESLQTSFKQDLELFCFTFPDAFYISERGRDYLGVPKEKQEKGRLLSAGFHSMMGYFRDDAPLCEMILNDDDRLQLDSLWKELDFVTAAPIRQYQGFLWFERTDHNFLRDAEFDFARPENKEALSEESINKLSKQYLEKAERMEAKREHLNAITDFFTSMNQQIRWVEQAHLDAEPYHIDAIERLADLAFRGSFVEGHRRGLHQYYRELRSKENLSHGEAIQDLLVSVLMSPEFCYRTDLGSQSTQRRLLNDIELANRLSYFLWSSMPDQRLLDKAREGKLRDRAVLLSEVDRMLRDDRVRGLAVEFGSQWLDFQRFQRHNSVDRNRFPQFTDSLREAMYEEPIRFLVDLVQQNRSVLSCIDAQHTFLNPELAKHYGLTSNDRDEKSEWWRESLTSDSTRGGLLPMAVFLTQNSPGLRTSPVKRGYWVVRRLLGEQIPPPPPDVPELPADESQLGELSLRQTLEKHRQLESCAVCHDRFDSIGLSFESYGPVGERRNRELGDKPIDDSALFPNGQSGRGLVGLREYILKDRIDDFQANLCRKLLAYALGRTMRLSDDLLIDEMRATLRSEDYRIGALIKTIVMSPQFLEKRGTIEKERSDVE